MTASRKVYLGVAIALIPLGLLGSLGCFCPQPMPFLYLGFWMVIGFAWERSSFLGAHVLTGLTYVITEIAVFTAGASAESNFGNLMEHSRRIALLLAALTGLVTFGAALVFERHKTAVGG
jgi:hypothetical protein